MSFWKLLTRIHSSEGFSLFLLPPPNPQSSLGHLVPSRTLRLFRDFPTPHPHPNLPDSRRKLFHILCPSSLFFPFSLFFSLPSSSPPFKPPPTLTPIPDHAQTTLEALRQSSVCGEARPSSVTGSSPCAYKWCRFSEVPVKQLCDDVASQTCGPAWPGLDGDKCACAAGGNGAF